MYSGLFLQNRLAGEIDAQFLENFLVNFAQHDSAVNLAAAQFRQLLKRLTAVFVVFREHRERHQNFVGVQARVVSAEILNLRVLNRLNHRLRNQFDFVVDVAKMFHHVEQQRRAASQEFA